MVRKLHINEQSKKLPTSYYKFVKDTISQITKIPKKDLIEVSSRDFSEYGFKPGYVTLYISWYTHLQLERDLEKLFASESEIQKVFNNNCEIQPIKNTETYFIRVSQEVIDGIISNDTENSIDSNKLVKDTATAKDTISFWATTVFDTRTTAVAYGAKIKCIDGWSFPGNLNRIQQKLGERKFYYFSKGGNKTFRTYEALVKFLKGIDAYIDVPSKEDIINAGYDEKYFTN